MRFPQIVVYEHDGRLAHVLRAVTADRRWVLREVRQFESCLRLLAGDRASVLVIRIPTDGRQELQLLSRAAQFSQSRTIAVVDEGDNHALAGLAWDLEADYVLAPPSTLAMLPDVVVTLMQTSAVND